MNLLLDVVVPQLARPHGPLARLVASVLDRGNRTINLHAVGALDLKPGQRVLEVGFGGGVGLATVLAHEPRVQLCGLDYSAEMVARCQQRFSDVELRQGNVEQLPWPDASFERVFGVNVSYFWPDLGAALTELHRVLAPRGRLILGIRPPETLQRFKFDVAGHRVWTPEQYVDALHAANFAVAQSRRMPDDSGGTYILTAHRGE
jgi:arsenite methyltransferase